MSWTLASWVFCKTAAGWIREGGLLIASTFLLVFHRQTPGIHQPSTFPLASRCPPNPWLGFVAKIKNFPNKEELKVKKMMNYDILGFPWRQLVWQSFSLLMGRVNRLPQRTKITHPLKARNSESPCDVDCLINALWSFPVDSLINTDVQCHTLW